MVYNGKKIFITFLLGGLILAFVQYNTQISSDPVMIAVATAIPIGLLSMYLINYNDMYSYTREYVVILCILTITMFFFYLAQSKLNIKNERDKYVFISFIIIVYALLIYFRAQYKTKFSK